VKGIVLLAIPPTVTTTFPDVAPVGTDVTMLVALQLVVVAAVPLNVTVPEDPKYVPVIVTPVPTDPDVGFRLVIEGGGVDVVTVKPTPLLATPPTVTTILPDEAPFGTGTVMLVDVQDVGVAATPLNVTVLVPCEDPKPPGRVMVRVGGPGSVTPRLSVTVRDATYVLVGAAVIVTSAPTGPAVGFSLVIIGAAAGYVTAPGFASELEVGFPPGNIHE
jgi:hypothetical protein